MHGYNVNSHIQKAVNENSNVSCFMGEWVKINNMNGGASATVCFLKKIKVVPEGCCRNFIGVKFKTVKLIGGRRFLAARSGLNVRTYSKLIFRHLLCLQSPTGK